jgi:hypothetical protein
MIARQVTSTHGFALELDDRGYHAWLIAGSRGRNSPKSLTPEILDEMREELRHLLSTHKVRLGQQVLERIEQYLALIADRSADATNESLDRFLVAKGAPAVEAVDGRFEWIQPESDASELNEHDPDPVDHYARNSIRTVTPGTIVGHITPGSAGRYGCDVFGRQISPSRLQPLQFRLGPGLCFAEGQSGAVVTKVAGRVELVANELRISEVLTIPGGVDFKSGNVDAVVPVRIGGDVRPRFQVRSTCDIHVDGDIDNAAIDTGGDLFVRGGIFGHQGPYRTIAGGSIHARVVDGATLRAGGDIEVAREIKASDLKAGGVVRLPVGAVLGGRIHALRGMVLRSAGSTAIISTELVAGEPDVIPAQPVRPGSATETGGSDEADGVDSVDQANAALPAPEPALISSATIEVQGVVHAGVRIAIGSREILITSSLKGPMRFERDENDIVVVNLRTLERTAFPTVPSETQPRKDPLK